MKLAPIKFDEPAMHDTKIEREIVERHRAVCDRCGWTGEWMETNPQQAVINGADTRAVGALGFHVHTEHQHEPA